jgi:hypothetical protein
LFVDGTSTVSRATVFNSTEALVIGSDLSANQRVAFGWMATPDGWNLGHKIVGDGINLYYYARLGQNGSHIFATNNAGVAAERLRITSAGRVGIGDSSPEQQLTVATSTGNCYIEAKRAFQSAGQVALQLTGGSGGTDWIVYQPTSSNDLRIFGNSGDRVTVTSTGLVGIGTQSPSCELEIGGNGHIHLTDQGRIGCNSGSGAPSDAYVKFYDSDIIGFHTTDDERARIDSSGYFRLSTNSGGIQFNGDTAAANALNDYEEGTWTPVIEGTSTTGSGTYTIQSGRYTKIGDSVLLRARISWTAHTGTGSIFISGLPFSVSEFSGFSVRTGNGLTVGANKTYVDQTTNKLVIEATITGTGDIILGAQYRS